MLGIERTAPNMEWIIAPHIIDTDLVHLSHKDLVRFGLFCVSQIETLWKDIPGSLDVIKSVELWLEDKATHKECTGIARIFCNFILPVQNSPTYQILEIVIATNEIKHARRCVACIVKRIIKEDYVGDFDKEKLMKEQWKYYNELRYFDEIAEQILIGG